jgi:hypothetical protein
MSNGLAAQSYNNNFRRTNDHSHETNMNYAFLHNKENINLFAKTKKQLLLALCSNGKDIF